jgi:hypothetical protein
MLSMWADFMWLCSISLPKGMWDKSHAKLQTEKTPESAPHSSRVWLVKDAQTTLSECCHWLVQLIAAIKGKLCSKRFQRSPLHSRCALCRHWRVNHSLRQGLSLIFSITLKNQSTKTPSDWNRTRERSPEQCRLNLHKIESRPKVGRRHTAFVLNKETHWTMLIQEKNSK